MTKLADTQLLILSGAARRDDLAVELPLTIPEATGKKVVGQLRKRSYLDEIAATGEMPVWRRDDDGAFALIITPAGLDAIGIAPEEQGPQQQSPVPTRASRKRGPGEKVKQQPTSNSAIPELSNAPRQGSKLEGVVALLRQPGGASITQMTEATGWLPHTTRAALTGLRKRGYSIERTPGSDGKTTYKLGPSSVATAGEGLSSGSEPA